MDDSTPLRVAVIIGSTRQGRAGEAVGRWFSEQANGRDGIELSVIDLAEFEFPASFPDRATPQMTDFTCRIAHADAFVIVTPEYNRSFPASLKQAIDFGYDEWQAKVVGFVSYGCGSNGVYAVEQLRGVFTELQAMTVRNSVGFNLLDGAFEGAAGGWVYPKTGTRTEPNIGRRTATGRTPAEQDRAAQAARTMLDQLTWWGRALRDARTRCPYVS